MRIFNIKNIVAVLVSCFVNVLFAAQQINVNQIDNFTNEVISAALTSDNVVKSNELANTALGNEGIRRVGALGGYTLEEFIEDSALRGSARDLPMFTYDVPPATNLIVSWQSGDVYDPVSGYYHLSSGTNVLTDNAVNFAYWTHATPTLVLWTTGTRPSVSNSVTLATFICNQGRIIQVGVTTPVGNKVLEMDDGFYNTMPSLIVNGLYQSPIGTNLTDILFTGGIEYHNLSERNVHDSSNLQNYPTNKLVVNYHTSLGVWDHASTNALPIDQWDNGTNLVNCTVSNWYRGVFVSFASHPNMQWIYPQVEYTNYTDAVAGNDPTLPYGFSPYIPMTTAYIFQGGDTTLRQESQYWIDRRFMIRRGSITSGGSGGGSSATPSLFEVLTQGTDSGGLIPNGLGMPTTAKQATSKEYVDSTINNINAHRAYVDNMGDDVTAQLESSIKPYQNIQTAIDAAAAVAADTNRYVVSISPGNYTENISMSNYVAIAGIDMESTKIIGSVTYPSAYTDIGGGEISLITVSSSNEPALTINGGDDNAYIGVRSCYLISLWDNDAEYMSVVKMMRGLAEGYGTTYCELNIAPTNGSSTISEAQIFEHTTDPANNGLSTFTAFGMSSLITCSDTNDNVNYMLTHDNLDSRCINTSIGSAMNVHLDDSTNHANNVRIVSHNTAIGRTLSMGTILRAYVNATNNCNFNFGWAENGTGENVAIVRGNHFRIIGAGSSNVWLGAAVTTNDGLRVYDSVYINNLADYPYPRIYTNNGNAGKYFINTVTESGAHLFGGAIDMSALGTPTITTPERGHMKQYAGVYAGLENPYYKDSSGNTMRGLRDNFYNGYNDDTTTMAVGSAVYISTGLSSDNTPKVKKCLASDPSTMPCIGIVVQVGGIVTGRVGRVMIMGRMEAGMDTSAFTSGQKLYVSSTVAGGITNIAPTGTNIAQLIGTCHIVSPTTGYVNVRVWSPDTIGTMTPSTIDAATIGGYTVDQLIAQQLTYYIWGSLIGPFTNGVTVSRLAQLDSPAGLSPRTNVYLNVTNGQFLGGISIATNQNPRVLTKGIVTINNELAYTGTNEGTALVKGTCYIFESDQTTLVQKFDIGNIVPLLIGSGSPYPYALDISITNDVAITDYNRILVFRTYLVSGFTGTNSISAYSQNGYLSRITISATSAGVYVPTSQYDQDTPSWDAASAWVVANSNGVASVFGRTGTWNTASVDATAATNWMTGHTSGVDSVFGRTGTWDTASTDATFSTNWIKLNSNAIAYVFGRTSTWDNAIASLAASSNSWNTASTWVTANSNKVNNAITNNQTSVTLTGTFSGNGTGLTNVTATEIICEMSIAVGSAQNITSAGVTVTNWSATVSGGTNFTTTHSNIIVNAAGTYEISSFGSCTLNQGDLRGALYTNNVAALDTAGHAISWRSANQNNGVYFSFAVSRHITIPAGTQITWRINSVSATEAITWDNASWELEKR